MCNIYLLILNTTLGLAQEVRGKNIKNHNIFYIFFFKWHSIAIMVGYYQIKVGLNRELCTIKKFKILTLAENFRLSKLRECNSFPLFILIFFFFIIQQKK